MSAYAATGVWRSFAPSIRSSGNLIQSTRFDHKYLNLLSYLTSSV